MGKLSQLLTLAQTRARAQECPYQGELLPREAWELLQLAPGAKLVDVRTRAEWDWVGRVPEAVEIEWIHYPGNGRNPHFIAELRRQVNPEALVLFLCRSGGRSALAATAAAEAGYGGCYNILEGFEGDKDANGQRNAIGGWRHAGLPWYQG
ncbi:MAG: rhodanese-like domain-containing protein [Betaproteobacteria bacterium]|nr:rhodanese-like domain-containing protein [Betaproteobacteria bacterium]MCL2885854.1 rhodanese-like domain-containing protein [Betaproteobacteria bacterium]